MHPAHLRNFTLALLLMVGLACDENAPTETRAPAVTTGAGPTDDADLAASDISTQTIALPVNQSIATTAPAPAFRVNQTGTGPDGIFQITRATSTQTALQGLTNGRGRAGFFQITNTGNTQPAVQGQTNGSGSAVSGLTTGLGNAGLFEINNTNSVSTALEARSNGHGNPTVHGLVTGTGGGAALFENQNPNNPSQTLRVATNGLGPAAGFSVTNIANNSPTISADGNVNRSSPLAARFIGDVVVTGTLSKGAGSFRIDHPLDPEHKYLQHSFVESPDMMDVYNGNVTLDAEGRATVELPDYFEALNQDFRYQLTAIGAPGPNLYIAQGVKQNHFRIAGGRAYAHVSWQVTGIRHDAYAEEHRIRVEEEKPAREEQLAAHR